MNARSFLTIIFTAFSLAAAAASVDTVTINSASMHKGIKAVVIMPDANGSTAKKFPVVYLLHGYSDNYAGWINKVPKIKALADQLQIIIVCPDGGFSSWYWNSPKDKDYQYETHITKELVPYIESHYPARAGRKARAITGLSMGGHGGFWLGIRHPDLFGAFGSMSGGLDIRPFPGNWDISKRIGDTSCCAGNWEEYSVINHLAELKEGQQQIIIDCGLGDFFLDVNRATHQKLMELKISHDYIERPGAHNWQYWANAIEYQLLFFRNYFYNGN
ncbi:esterase family protein [Flavihumibacter rivuli]|uniref:alpha/beta hydrolase n=1 Tax=Flavihumibacter rivuli TaxID=2838156 RepID=UPI001BDE583A|nr:alpha/beta hydrolase family protein [Flavihumibacter rivuli]ULQ57280.1 esterase family protein [Flavihumibacter rivuli]